MRARITGLSIVAAGFAILGCSSDKAGLTAEDMANRVSPGQYAMESYTQDSLGIQVFLEFLDENLAHETHLAYVRHSPQDSVLWEIGKFDVKYAASDDQLHFTPVRGVTDTKSKTDMVILFARFESGALTLKNITDSTFEFQKEGERSWGRAYRISTSLPETL